MITIENAKVETLGMNQARPVGKTVVTVTIGDLVLYATEEYATIPETTLIAGLSSDIVKITEGRE
jgi:hypothetical protein